MKARLFPRVANRAKDLLFIEPATRFWQHRLLGKVLVMLYHRVIDESDEFPLLSNGGVPVITRKELRREIEFLVELGATFLTFGDLRQGHFPGNDEFGVVVTFDDGFKDTYVNGLGVLSDAGLHGVVFQSTAMLTGERLLHEHWLYWLHSIPAARREFLRLMPGEYIREVQTETAFTTADCLQKMPFHLLEELRERLGPIVDERAIAAEMYPQARDLQLAVTLGHEIGSHGHWHLHRSTLRDAEFHQELSFSAQKLDELLGCEARAFSYPYGAQKSGDEFTVKSYFAQAATCERVLIDRSTDPYFVGRFSSPGIARNQFRFRRWLLTGRI